MYKVDMYDKRKQKRIFHINMLWKWNKPTIYNCHSEEFEDHREDVMVWADASPRYLDQDTPIEDAIS